MMNIRPTTGAWSVQSRRLAWTLLLSPISLLSGWQIAPHWSHRIAA